MATKKAVGTFGVTIQPNDDTLGAPSVLALLVRKAIKAMPNRAPQNVVRRGGMGGSCKRPVESAKPSTPEVELKIKSRDLNVHLRNFRYERDFKYTKRAKTDTARLRREFDSKSRKEFLQDLANDPDKVARMKRYGLTDADIAKMKDGKMPDGYQVHHKKPLDDGGDNSFDNLVLIKNEPYHKAVTSYQNTNVSSLPEGSTKTVNWPMIDDYIYPNY